MAGSEKLRRVTYFSRSILVIVPILTMCHGMLTDGELRSYSKKNQIIEYDIILPKIHKPSKMSKRGPDSTNHNEQHRVTFTAFDEEHHVVLERNRWLLRPGLEVEYLQPNGSIRKEPVQTRNCHFFATSISHRGSTGALSTCRGLRGVLALDDDMLFIEPLKEDHARRIRRNIDDTTHPHLIYKRQAAEGENDECPDGDLPVADNGGSTDTVTLANETTYNGPYLGAKYVEIFYVVDKLVYDEHLGETESYATTILNIMSRRFADPSLDISIRFSVVRLLISMSTTITATNPSGGEESITPVASADTTLPNFCTWQASLSVDNDTDPNDWDLALLFTGHDIYRDDMVYSLAGRARLGGTCNVDSKCSVTENSGLSAGLIMAHETGHSLGLEHDITYGCTEGLNIMSTSLARSTGAFEWSSCSSEHMKIFIGSQECMDDLPTTALASILELPGQSVDDQCKMVMGNTSAYSCSSITTCTKLYCSIPDDSSCYTSSVPAEGSQCGDGMWCINAKCVSTSLALPSAVDGGWTEFVVDFSTCSRSCGTGVQYRSRSCTNPTPQWGGVPCVGDSHIYKVCNEQPCTTSQDDYRNEQCAATNSIPFNGVLYTWTDYQHSSILGDDLCIMSCLTSGAAGPFLNDRPGNFHDGTLCWHEPVTDATKSFEFTKSLCLGGKCQQICTSCVTQTTVTVLETETTAYTVGKATTTSATTDKTTITPATTYKTTVTPDTTDKTTVTSATADKTTVTPATTDKTTITPATTDKTTITPATTDKTTITPATTVKTTVTPYTTDKTTVTPATTDKTTITPATTDKTTVTPDTTDKTTVTPDTTYKTSFTPYATDKTTVTPDTTDKATITPDTTDTTTVTPDTTDKTTVTPDTTYKTTVTSYTTDKTTDIPYTTDKTTIVPDTTDKTTVTSGTTDKTTATQDTTDKTTVIPGITYRTTVTPDTTDTTSDIPDPTDKTSVTPDKTDTTTDNQATTEEMTTTAATTERITTIPFTPEVSTTILDPTDKTSVTPDKTATTTDNQATTEDITTTAATTERITTIPYTQEVSTTIQDPTYKTTVTPDTTDKTTVTPATTYNSTVTTATTDKTTVTPDTNDRTTVTQDTTAKTTGSRISTRSTRSTMSTKIDDTTFTVTKKPVTTLATDVGTRRPTTTLTDVTTTDMPPTERIYIDYGCYPDRSLSYFQYSFLAWYTIKLNTGFPISSGRLYTYITFTSTGMIHFSTYYPRRYSLFKYINPSTFSFFDQLYGDPAIAVFGAPVDLYRGNPKIYYQVYDINKRYGNSAALLAAVKERLYGALSLPAGLESFRFINGINFILKVTWVNVQTPGSIAGQEINTYQAILFTDGSRSGVLTMYQQGSFQWNPYSKAIPARIGYNIKHDRLNIYQGNYPAIRYASYRPDLRIGNTGRMGRDIYRLDENPDWYVNPRRYCQDWYQDDLSKTSWWAWWWAWWAEPCPCTRWQAMIDRRFTRCNYPYYGYGYGYDYGYGYGYGYGYNYGYRYGLSSYYYGTACYQPRWPSFGGGYRCTYDRSALTRGYRASHYQSVMPSNARFFSYYYYSLHYYYSWIERDVLPRFYCCDLAGGNFCNLYESRRPRSHCWGYRPPWFGWFWGDPHINTLDGRKYTFNGLGEYTTMAYSHGDPFMLQARTGKAFNNSVPVEHGTVFTGFAATQEITKVEFQLNDDRTDMSILVNGTAINMTEFLVDGLDSRDSTFILSVENDTVSEGEIKVTALFQPEGYPSSSFTVTFKDGLLDLGVMVPSEYAQNGTGRGLLGNVNGNKSDDFLLRNGTLLMDPPGRNLTDREIFQFGQSWMISENESLFEYGDGNWSYYNPSDYKPMFLDELLVLDPNRTQAAREACGEDEACLFDYLAVSPEMGKQTMTTGNQLDNDLQNLDNFPPNVTSVEEIGETDALQEGEVLFMQVGVTVTLNISAHDPNEVDTVSFTFNDTAPDGADISSDGILTWTPPDLNVSSIEIIVMDGRGAETSLSYKVMICRCENEGVCDFDNQAEGQDLNANGFAVVTCNCSGGWSGDHCDVDYDSCEGTPCFEGVICYDGHPSSDEEYTCGPCPPQLSGNGTTCFDFNECADDDNDCEQNCENNLGSYTCSCDPDYLLALDQRSCDEISECHEALRTSTKSANCTCEPGFQIVNGTCSDFDECESDVDLCPPDISTCFNLPGDYNCTCHSGYDNSSPNECQDIDECEQSTHDCDSSADRVCMNTPGNFSCVCRENTTEINGICLNALTLSLNVRLTFISGLSVESYPDTIDSQENQRQLAQDVLRFLNASSKLGNDTLQAVSVQDYALSGTYVLVSFRVDIKPGASLSDSSLEQIFMELLPRSRLIAPDHQVMQEDINECEQSSDVCRNGNCTNTDGSYYCTCNKGFLGTGNDSCTDINECLGAHNCNQTCLNSPGNYSCSCLPGFELHDDGFTCNEIDECESNPCAYGGTCTDGINMYNCTCALGYTGINCSTEIPTTPGTPLSTAVESTATEITQPKTSTPQGETNFPSTTSSSTIDSATTATPGLTTTEENGETMATRGPKTEGIGDESTTYKTTTSLPEEQPFVIIIRLEITANRRTGNPLEFSEELEDHNSAAFKDLEIIYCGATTRFLMDNLETSQLINITCDVLSFRSGSVIGDLLIVIEATSQASADSLGDEADELKLENGTYPYANESIYVKEFASDRTDSCETDPCQNGGTCADGFKTFTCACPLDYTGEDCSRDSGGRGLSPGTIVGIILGAMSGALCFVVCTCCIMLQIVRRKKENKKRERKAMEYQSENKGIINEEWSEPSSDDQFTNFSLDRRHYKIRQAVDHFRSYQGMDGRMEETHFYAGAIERNPIHDIYN